VSALRIAHSRRYARLAMHRGSSARRRMLPLAISAALTFAGCLTPVSKGYEIHTSDLTCDEANRQVYAALRDMQMEITAFTPAKPGQPGHVSGVRKSESNPLAGDVEIRCDGGRVDIEADQRGDLLGDKQFERGIFLSVTGRADLEVVREGRYTTGEVRKRAAQVPAGQDPSMAAPSASRSSTAPAAMDSAGATLDVQMEALRGFASVLDFDADLAAAGILPMRVSIRNTTRRAYDFDPSRIVLNVSGQRTRAMPLTQAEAKARLATVAADPAVGDVDAAKNLLAKKAIAGGRLAPGTTREGFVYFPLGDYDRARLSFIDSATGEAEAFVVYF
jgi:hypothetical protein